MKTKRHILNYAAVALATLAATACNDFLDEVPDNRTVIDTPEAVSELLVSAYPDGNCVFFTECMSDNVTDRGNTLDPYVQAEWDRANRQAFYWEDIDMTYQDSPSYFWMVCYQAISAANHALEAIAELEAKGTDCSVQKGEALVCRAYNHFMLVNVFSQHYDPAYADDDLGVPYVTAPEKEVFGHYERLSVKETYDMIRADLEQGLPLISNKAYGETPKYHFTREAAQAFAARFYLYVGEWEKAAQAAGEALGDNPTLRDWNAYIQMSTANREKNYTSVQESANLLLASTLSMFAADQPFDLYGYSTELNHSLYVQTDNLVGGSLAYRAEAYNLSSEALTAVCDRIEALAMQGRYTEACRDIELFLTNKIRDYDAAKQPVTPEMVEAYYKDKAPLHPWYESRMDARQMAFVQCAADFRRRELLMQGGRWFDIKRFDIEVTHEAYQTGAADVLVRRDLRRAVQIPQEVISYGIAPNPR